MSLCEHFNLIILSEMSFCFVFKSDLENFKTKMRSTVSVREGQGVVLLCGPPPHSGGKKCSGFIFLYLLSKFQGKTHSVCTVIASLNCPEKLDNPSIGFCQLCWNMRNSTKDGPFTEVPEHYLLIPTRRVLKAREMDLI